jgi:hypothetical protein
VDVAGEAAAVLSCRYHEVGEPDATERVAVLVATDRGWVGRVEFDTVLSRWQRTALEPSVEVAERSAVCGCVAQDVPVRSAWCTRDAVPGEEPCQRLLIPGTAGMGRPCDLPQPEDIGVGLAYRKKPRCLGLTVKHQRRNAKIVSDLHPHRHRLQLLVVNISGIEQRTSPKVQRQKQAIEDPLYRLDGIRVTTKPHRRL